MFRQILEHVLSILDTEPEVAHRAGERSFAKADLVLLAERRAHHAVEPAPPARCAARSEREVVLPVAVHAQGLQHVPPQERSRATPGTISPTRPSQSLFPTN